jgi:hypothetical protein
MGECRAYHVFPAELWGEETIQGRLVMTCMHLVRMSVERREKTCLTAELAKDAFLCLDALAWCLIGEINRSPWV